MTDHYEILGISRSASVTEVRSAFKRLAMRYHPDRNPGDAEAEEKFKKINEAYHTLTDPVKKARYDMRFQVIPQYSEQYIQNLYRRQYYSQQKYNQGKYILDREYFRIQGLAFLVFIVISGFCFAIIHAGNYFWQMKQLQRWNTNTESLKVVNTLFGSGKFDDAFNLIRDLKEKDPLEFRFSFAKDSLVSALREMAEKKYNEKNFNGAVNDYLVLKNYEDPVRFETIRKISLCQFYLGNFKESLQALKHLHNQQPKDLELVYQIGMINLQYLKDYKEALYYFTLGKKLFKQNLSDVYGEAFEVVMDPADAPDIYFDIFTARAATQILMRNYSEAVKDCNWAIYLRPRIAEPYITRAQANIKLGKGKRACEDLQVASSLNYADASQLILKYCK